MISLIGWWVMTVALTVGLALYADKQGPRPRN